MLRVRDGMEEPGLEDVGLGCLEPGENLLLGTMDKGRRQHTMGPCVELPRLQAAILAQNWLNSCTKDPAHGK